MRSGRHIFVTGIVAVLLTILPSGLSASIPGFFDELFSEFETEYASIKTEQYGEFCAAYGLDMASEQNRRTFLRIHFLHDLLTTVDASDCSQGGFLKIPYFWHWIEPNPRHSIMSLPDSILLTAMKPPAPYRRYASCADIDRIPALFLGDLVSEEPGYYHPDCGSFYSFGWCSEREMAFTAVMVAWGYQCKIWQSGVHTFSVVLCEFTGPDGAAQHIEARVDNTFDMVRWKHVTGDIEPGEWTGRTGEGSDIAWYNDVAHSSEQIEAIRAIPVSLHAAARIREMVSEGLGN